jgi:hypothetical protein
LGNWNLAAADKHKNTQFHHHSFILHSIVELEPASEAEDSLAAEQMTMIFLFLNMMGFSSLCNDDLKRSKRLAFLRDFWRE